MRDTERDAKIAKLRSVGRCEFWSFVEREGKLVSVLAEDWLQEQEPAVRAKFLSRWTALRQQEGKDWRRKPYENLRGDGKGLGEIRFEILNVQYRPLGYLEPTKFTIVFFATEKGGKFVPTSAIATGLKRKAAIQNGDALSQEMNLELLLT